MNQVLLLYLYDASLDYWYQYLYRLLVILIASRHWLHCRWYLLTTSCTWQNENKKHFQSVNIPILLKSPARPVSTHGWGLINQNCRSSFLISGDLSVPDIVGAWSWYYLWSQMPWVPDHYHVIHLNQGLIHLICLRCLIITILPILAKDPINRYVIGTWSLQCYPSKQGPLHLIYTVGAWSIITMLTTPNKVSVSSCDKVPERKMRDLVLYTYGKRIWVLRCLIEILCHRIK